MTAAAVLVLTSPFNAASHDIELSMSPTPTRRRPVSIALTLRSDNYGQTIRLLSPNDINKGTGLKANARTKDQGPSLQG